MYSKQIRLFMISVNTAVLILMGVLSFQAEATATTPNAVRNGIGVIDSNNPMAFYQGFDGNLWMNQWNGSQWTLNNMATPSRTVGIESTIGTFNNGNLGTLIKGTDGNLWVDYWNGSQWTWSNLGTPPLDSQGNKIGIASSIGTNLVNNQPYIWVKGTDGNLWLDYWTGSQWLWSKMGTPSAVGIESSIGTFNDGHPAALVKGTDGNLWMNQWNGSQWTWSNMGTPPLDSQGNKIGIASSIGTTLVSNRPYVWIKGTDGNLWLDYWTGSQWLWSKIGTPPQDIQGKNVGIASAIGTDLVNNQPYVWITGTDGNLWLNYWAGSQWLWSKMGMPSSSVGIAGAVGVMPHNGFPLVYVTGSDSNLWLLSWNGSVWQWTNQSNQNVSNSYLYPKYKVLSVVYAPPGSKSNVSYANSNVRGTSSSYSHSFSQDFSFNVSIGPKIFNAGTSDSWTQESNSSFSDSCSVTTTSSDIVTGPASSLGLDHDADIIYLWLNPAAVLTITDSTSTSPNSVRWGGYTTNPADVYAVTGNGNANMDIVWLTLGQLKNPSTITDQDMLNRLARSWDNTMPSPGLTADDYAQILKVNPFASNPLYDPRYDANHQFDSLGFSVDYIPSQSGYTPPQHTYNVSQTVTSAQGQGATATYKVGFSASSDLAYLTTKISGNLTTTDKWTTTNSSGSTTSSSLNITGPAYSDNYPSTSPKQFQVWRDNIYGSYMFFAPKL